MVSGQPHSSVRSATDGTTGIGVNTGSTAAWTAYQSSTANDANGVGANAIFIANAMISYMFTYDQSGNVTTSPSLIFTGLNTAKTYALEWSSGRAAGGITGAQRYADFYIEDANGTRSLLNVDQKGSTAILSFKNIVPLSGGIVRFRMNPGTSVGGDLRIAYINAARIRSQATTE